MKEMIARVGDMIKQSGIASVCLTGEELIRCKDCKYGAPTVINGVWLSVTCNGVDHKSEWFCADGKRRDDDDD